MSELTEMEVRQVDDIAIGLESLSDAQVDYLHEVTDAGGYKRQETTLRDQVAIAVLQAHITGQDTYGMDPRRVADAFDYADEYMRQRAER